MLEFKIMYLLRGRVGNGRFCDTVINMEGSRDIAPLILNSDIRLR